MIPRRCLFIEAIEDEAIDDKEGFCSEIKNIDQGEDLIITYGNHSNNTKRIGISGKSCQINKEEKG